MKISKELSKGSNGLLVLSVLRRRELYGYQIIRELELQSEEVFQMSEGTLYPILHSLEKEKFLESYWEEKESGRRRRYYRITDKGIAELEHRAKEWKSYSNAVEKVLQIGMAGA